VSSDRLRHAVVWISLASALLPLVVLPSFYYPYVVPRVVAFRALSSLAFLLWVPLALLDARYRTGWRSPVALALGSFCIAETIAAAAGIDPHRSFWGDFARMGGVLTTAHFLMWLVAASSCLRTREWRRLFALHVLVATGIAFTGILTHAIRGELLTERIDTVSGNPAVLATYLLMVLPLAVYLAATTRRSARLWHSIAATMLLCGLVFTFSRGAILAFAVGGLVTALWAAVLHHPRPRFVLLVAGLLLVGGGVAGRLLVDPSLDPRISGLQRLTQLGRNTSSAQVRLLAWEAAWQGFRERPFLGQGPENYYAVFNRHFDPLMHSISSQDSLVDRPHNGFLEALVSSGPLGLLAYLGLFASALLTLRAPVVDAKTRMLVGVSALVYAINVSLLFDMLLPFLLLLSILAFGDRVRQGLFDDHGGVPVPAFLLALPLVAWGTSVWYLDVRPAAASVQLHQALGAARVSRGLEQLQAIEHGSPMSVSVPALLLADRLEDELRGKTAYSQEQAATLDSLVVVLKKEWHDRPLDVRVGLELLELSTLRYAMRGDARDAATSEGLYAQIVAVSPRRGDVHLLAAHLSALASRPDEALQRANTARDLNPDWPDPYWMTGIYLLEAGRDSLAAVRSLRTALRLGYAVKPQDIPHVQALSIARNDLELRLDLWRAWTYRHPDDVAGWQALAAVARELGNDEEAREARRRTQELRGGP
jgi:O-antigen ligase/Flp pilus assembly protein TadD